MDYKKEFEDVVNNVSDVLRSYNSDTALGLIEGIIDTVKARVFKEDILNAYRYQLTNVRNLSNMSTEIIQGKIDDEFDFSSVIKFIQKNSWDTQVREFLELNYTKVNVIMQTLYEECQDILATAKNSPLAEVKKVALVKKEEKSHPVDIDSHPFTEIKEVKETDADED